MSKCKFHEIFNEIFHYDKIYIIITNSAPVLRTLQCYIPHIYRHSVSNIFTPLRRTTVGAEYGE